MSYTLLDWIDGKLEAHFRIKAPSRGLGDEYYEMWLPVDPEVLELKLRQALAGHLAVGNYALRDFLYWAEGAGKREIEQ